MSKIKSVIRISRTIRYRLIAEGIVIGVLAGIVTSLYRLALTNAEKLSQHVYMAARGSAPIAAAVFGALIILALICGFLVKSEPMIKGSGIPQVEGKLDASVEYSWIRVLIKKFIAGTLSILGGLSLGREGPSIQLGACAGEGVSKLFHRIRFEEKYMITCGASAGLASAFNAPLSGVLFALEEVHKSFSPNVLLPAMAAAITGDLVSKSFFGTSSVFDLTLSAPISILYYPYLAAMGIVLGLFGAMYNKTLIGSQVLYSRIKIPEVTKQIIPFIIAGILGLCLPQVLGGGHRIVEGIVGGSYTLLCMAVLLIVKFLFSMVSFGSGAAGGIFFPLLVLGALCGAVTGRVGVDFLGMPSGYMNTFMLLGMVGMFTGIVRAPITGIVLIVEMSGSLTQLLPLTLVAACAYITADCTGVKPVYEMLLDRLLNKKPPENGEKLIIEIQTGEACKINGAPISSLHIPHGCVLLGVERGGEELMPEEAKTVRSGDVFTVMCRADKESRIRYGFEKLFSR